MFHCLILSVSNWNPARPGGVHRVATHLRLNGWDAEVVDFADYWTFEELQTLFISRVTPNTKFVGLASVFNRGGNHETINAFCAWVKMTHPNIIIISGGQVEPVHLMHTDYHINGYGELAMDALLGYLFSNKPAPKFTFSLSRIGKVKVVDANMHYPAHPQRQALIKYEARDFIVPGEWGHTEFSRGCKFHCKFCSLPALGVKGDYTRDADDFRDHVLSAYDDWGIENYLLTDETVNDRTEKLTKFADVVETLPWKPYFVGMIRADLMITRPKDREELLRMGLLGHFYGIESFNYASLKAVNKGMHPDKMKAGLLDCKEFFKSHVGKRYRASAYFIGGLQHETLDTLEETKQWLKKNWADQEFGASELEIQDMSNNMAYKISTLSTNYGGAGYRKMTEEEIVEVCAKEGVPTSFADTERDFQPGMAWANEHMNVIQAAKWARSMLAAFRVGRIDLKKVQSRYLQYNYCQEDGRLLTLDERLALTMTSASPKLDNFADIFVPAYIKKKLSC